VSTTKPPDNPAWNSIEAASGQLADLVQVLHGRAGRYHRDVSPFAAVAYPLDSAAWTSLAELLDGDSAVVVVEPELIPDGWEIVRVINTVQLEGTRLEPAPDPDALRLTTADAPGMLALVERTRPGPFRPRTVEMGSYLGVRREGTLIAMAGERLRPSGWTEISAVCTDEAFRGQGISTRLMRAIADGISRRDEKPFLHAASSNENAIRLYKSLGFEFVCELSFVVLRHGGA
jgi:ribosomal protein S18 acetylase RimI-like enzyme